MLFLIIIDYFLCLYSFLFLPLHKINSIYMMKKTITFLSLFFYLVLFAQQAHIEGMVRVNGKVEPSVNILAKNSEITKGTFSNKWGNYDLHVPAGTYTITASSIGLKTVTKQITVKEGEKLNLDFDMEEDLIGLDEVVITASQKKIPQYLAPVVVNKISPKIFEATQSLSLSEGLKFTPGLRTETNCQNCGTNQLRINGLDGAYSQILINNRPVFSALAGVYALEMYPVNMIDRVEVVKGSGSALYGGNAIGGTVNILTKDPVDNSFSLGTNISFLDGEIPDKTVFANTSVVSDNLNKGITIFGFRRNRAPYDANQDGFSEITKLRSSTFGADMFWNTSETSKLKLNLNAMDEFRRGGDKFDLQPHESNITEQLEHKIYGGDLSFEHLSKDLSHKFSYYVSLQKTERNSFYGGGLGRIISSEDDYLSLTQDEKDTFFGAISAYGNSKGVVGVGGIQYSYDMNDNFSLFFGTEYKYDNVYDDTRRMGRIIDQTVRTYGTYLQSQYKPTQKLTFLVGGRYDYVDINGDYMFYSIPLKSKLDLKKFVPRLTSMYDITNNIKFRISYAQGYRSPQAFDEELHTEVLGGDQVFIELSQGLKAEKSDSFTASLNYIKKEGKNQVNIIIEGFYNSIKDKFTNEHINDIAGGIRRRLKVNADGDLKVIGLNAEANFAFGNSVIWQIGTTYHKSKFSNIQSIYKSDTKEISSKKAMRTPDLYGFTTLTYNPTGKASISYSGVFTGRMYTLHESVEELVKTPSFFEQSIKGSYLFSLSKDFKLEVSTGIQNIFNAYQDDFDKGVDRDPNYIYGPQRPRTFFLGATFKM